MLGTLKLKGSDHYAEQRSCFSDYQSRAGRGSVDLSEAITVLQAHGWEVAVRQKLHGGHATELACNAVREGYNVVVDCGGDGTLNEIVEGVAGTGASVGVIPGGTANLWAHEVGISPSPQAAALQLVGAEQHRVDVGRVAVNGHHKRHFLLMAGLGFDGAVLRELSKPLKKRVGWLADAPAVMRALRAFRSVAVDVDMDARAVAWTYHTGRRREHASLRRLHADVPTRLHRRWAARYLPSHARFGCGTWTPDELIGVP